MKKILTIFFTIAMILVIIIVVKFSEYRANNLRLSNLNKEYEYYNKESIPGIEIASLINKCVDSNTQNNISKDENGMYISNTTNSLKVEIKMNMNNTVYQMETIYKLGLDSFLNYFGTVNFKCTGIEYHEETGKVSKLVFESLDTNE